VVLPAVSGGRLQDASLRAWLSRSDLRYVPTSGELLSTIAGGTGLPYPSEGLAALRMWGQTGERPTVWIAAADPVYLEPRLDHLCLHALPEDSLEPREFGELIEHLQVTLGDEKRVGFIRLANCGYLRASEPLSTANVPAYLVDQSVPSEFLPAGEGAASYRKLVGEIEMSLHEHEINQRRIGAGQRPVNSLWVWGGGFAPERVTRPQPRLFAEDPLLLGYWDSANAIAELWPGSLGGCIRAAQGETFVGVPPLGSADHALVEDCLRELRAALQEKRLGRTTILFRDGLRAELTHSQRLRFWRRNSHLLD
jgi:hypothetical protein